MRGCADKATCIRRADARWGGTRTRQSPGHVAGAPCAISASRALDAGLAARDGPQDGDQQAGSEEGHDQRVEVEAVDAAVAQQRENEAAEQRPDDADDD